MKRIAEINKMKAGLLPLLFALFFSMNLSYSQWVQTNEPSNYVYCLAISGTNIFAGTSGDGVYLSTDNGGNWTQVGLQTITIYSLAISGTNIFAGGGGAGSGVVFLSKDNGKTWTFFTIGSTNADVMSLAVSGENMFAGTLGSGVWKRPLSEMITAVEERVPDQPKEFGLEQNYPNPFNPTTTITFSLPTRVFVTLKVYDALGREVASLVSEELPAGRYTRQWNAAGMPSGVYFYRINAGNFVQTKKVVIMK